MLAAILAFTIGYLTGSAIIALFTIDQPRRALDARTSIALATLRAGMAIALVGVLLQVTP